MALLDYVEASNLLRKYGIRSIESRYVTDAEDAKEFSKGRKIVLKLLSQKALHKSKAGLVKVDLKEDAEIEEAFRQLAGKGRKLRPYKIIAQRMAESGIEAIFGGRKDDQFGNLILLGLGGVYAEAFRDVAVRICPITRYDARQMVGQLRSRDIITNNGESEDMVVELLMKISKMLEENRIKELDLNPIIIRKGGYDVVDIRMIW
jgi:succinyl-CoA synthetase beta subunit